MEQFKKDDQGKPQFEYLPLELLSGVNEVLRYGAGHYGVNNWKKEGFVMSRAYNALIRHMNAFWNGESIDPETGLNHLDHAMCNLLFLKYHYDNHIETCDDRPSMFGCGIKEAAAEEVAEEQAEPEYIKVKVRK